MSNAYDNLETCLGKKATRLIYNLIREEIRNERISNSNILTTQKYPSDNEDGGMSPYPFNFPVIEEE